MRARLAVFFWAFSLIAYAGFGQDKPSVTQFSPPAIPPDKGYFVQEIRGGVYWVTDGLYNTMFIVSSDHAYVRRAGPLAAITPRDERVKLNSKGGGVWLSSVYERSKRIAAR